MLDLSAVLVPIPDGIGDVYYIPQFVTEQEEEYLVKKITEAPQTAWKTLSNRRLQIYGGEVSKPANVLIPKPLPKFFTDYPDIIKRLSDTGAFTNSKHKGPNHVLVNEYEPGQGIMPHQDGSSYHPVVCTISLGSHTVAHYYRYQDDGASDGEHTGRSIDPQPVVSVLLEPRSLLITTNELYTTLLHGIESISVDHFQPHDEDRGIEESDAGDANVNRFRVANWEMVKDTDIKACLERGGSKSRSTRVSLTCRDVEKVMAGSRAFGRTK